MLGDPRALLRIPLERAVPLAQQDGRAIARQLQAPRRRPPPGVGHDQVGIAVSVEVRDGQAGAERAGEVADALGERAVAVAQQHVDRALPRVV